MGHGVENLAHDPISKNLYWTDSELKWVMMTDPTFSYYTIIFSTDPDPAYALAIHIPKRYVTVLQTLTVDQQNNLYVISQTILLAPYNQSKKETPVRL